MLGIEAIYNELVFLFDEQPLVAFASGAARFHVDQREVAFQALAVQTAFQFRDGEPHPAIARILAALPVTLTPWQIAFWFVSANGWLDDETPKDRLDEVEAVIEAARHEGEEVMG